MAVKEGILKQISDITKCSICLETLKEPKLLPCIHTFCLHCLQNLCKNNDLGDNVPCPLCRKPFTIPAVGVNGLITNFFMQQLLQLKQSEVSTTDTPDKTILCELCSELEVETISTDYCVECQQHFCDKCTMVHKKLKMSKSHQVVKLNDIPSIEEQAKMAVRYCPQHPDKPIELYCSDCKTVTCFMCYVENHNKHECTDVKKSAKKFSEQLKKDIENVTRCTLESKRLTEELEIYMNIFLKDIVSTQAKISDTYDKLISLIQSHQHELLQELDEFKANQLKKIENRKYEVEHQLMITESFTRYCQEMNDKGSAYDISRAADDLHVRAEEIVKTQEKPGDVTLSKFDILFSPTSAASVTDNCENFIGKFAFKEKESVKTETFLNNAQTLRVIAMKGPVHGITVLGSEMFAVESYSHVCVYNTDYYTVTPRYITIDGSSNLHAIVASPRYNCLYISDTKRNIVYRYCLSNDDTTQWPVGGQCWGLSLTNTYNVLVTLRDTKEIKEYTPDGGLIRKISLDSSIVEANYSVQLSSDRLVVSHGGTTSLLCRVCIVDMNGHIIQSYGGSCGIGVEEFDSPMNLAVDRNGNILVTDYGNYRVVLLSSSLTHLGYITLSNRHKLDYPSSLHLDQLNHRLYIGEVSIRKTDSIFVLGVDDSV